ncbi:MULTISPECIES: 5-methyltetrahydropteroyltriglutamate--homocysteine methyltransferase [unclassified Phenylobacterium]|uniref:5-methyltetrahydropteroyltriglutamate-- homocysteine methyltransferase n=1 Tax=unclassified Phenylobacterium TaxID=2640670 RepID=UPI000839E5A1|nr:MULTISPECIES: 5-methyltetrahydropteroyltriglutamate--homocysteine methyltransferase [unclassified Phenylobacterium]
MLLPGLPLLPTTIVGSYPQPDWLIDREGLKSRLPPRVRAQELWRIKDPRELADAQEAATLVAISDQKLAGIDIVGDGEMRRESYSNRLATALGGIETDPPGMAMDRTGAMNPVPRVAGPIRRLGPIEAQDAAFLKARAGGPVKITIPGPFTMTQQAQNDHYTDARSLALDYADAVNAEMRDLFAAGCDIVQLDEPYLQAKAEEARSFAIEAINRAVKGVGGITALHICFGYAHVHQGASKPGGYAFLEELEASDVDIISIEAAQPNLDPQILRELPTKHIMYGVIDLNDPNVEGAETVAQRIRRALPYIDAERLIVAPDCGMKYQSRAVAFGKLKAMSDGAAIVRRELAG